MTLIPKAIDTTSISKNFIHLKFFYFLILSSDIIAINLYGYAAGGETPPVFCLQKTTPF